MAFVLDFVRKDVTTPVGLLKRTSPGQSLFKVFSRARRRLLLSAVLRGAVESQSGRTTLPKPWTSISSHWNTAWNGSQTVAWLWALPF